MQNNDRDILVDFLGRFWHAYSVEGTRGGVTPKSTLDLSGLLSEPLPDHEQSVESVLRDIELVVERGVVKTSHPMFLGYVTPPSLDIAVLGEAVSAILNQNSMFEELSPIATALEKKTIAWLGEICGFQEHQRHGILVSGGSEANLYGVAVARECLMNRRGESANPDPRRMRIYCSEYAHHSVNKAAALLGIGGGNVVAISANAAHQVNIEELQARIEEDLSGGGYIPLCIFGSAGTRLSCAFDNLEALRGVADRYSLWLHVDAAYGGFFRLAKNPPPQLRALHLADSVTLDPHKLLFVPFDCGCFLIRNDKFLRDTFGAAGEYELKPHSLNDFASLGLQLGRSMKALKVWLALKYVGIERFSREFDRLLSLAQSLGDLIRESASFELLAPIAGTAVCFRITCNLKREEEWMDNFNRQVRNSVVTRGQAFLDVADCKVDGVALTGLRVCMTNYRTDTEDVLNLLTVLEEAGQQVLAAESNDSKQTLETFGERVTHSHYKPSCQAVT